MPSPNANPTPITPPRVPLIDPRTNLIDRAWYLFFLSLNNIATTVVDDVNLGPSPDSLIASYDAALQSLTQTVDSQPSPVDLSSDLAALKQEVETAPRLEIGTIASQNAENVNITGGKISGLVPPLPTASGGTALSAFTSSGAMYATSTTVLTTGTLPIASGGSGATTAAGARTNFGATTLGSNLFTITNPSAITFPRFNSDNTVSSLNASDFRTAIGAGTVTSVGTTGSVNGITLTGTVTTAGTLTLGGTLSGVDLTSQVSGILPVGNGGSGANSLTGYVYGNGTSAFTASTTIPNTAITGLGTMSTENIGVSGSFITANVPSKTVTVVNGIITSIV